MRKFRKNGALKEHPLIVHGDPKAVGSEAFRTLRTNLRFISPDQELKTILITSVGPGDGKSTISANLAVALAQSGQRVALVGCDLRKPVLHKVFGLSNAVGLTSFLTGNATLATITSSIKQVENLDLIPSGPVPPNPAELLQSKAMVNAISTLRENYDTVIFDGAPVIAVTDAAVMANQVDGTVLVIRSRQVPRDVALHAKDLLEQADAKLLGVVLNGVRPQDQKNYQYYYYYYEDAEQA
ncbi:MAG TPA: CpsD/CapB family tyrosine-protein kinase [Limnochordia bacterium]|nr:CpsD/CapB family tyrosine-protein kinase [Limnochordia bacterium]